MSVPPVAGVRKVGSNESSGALSYENGSWRARPPTVRISVQRRPRSGLHGTVSLVTVEL
ncbi:MAG: hypothetical protein ABEL51_16105 [Salinibacter sp.]